MGPQRLKKHSEKQNLGAPQRPSWTITATRTIFTGGQSMKKFSNPAAIIAFSLILSLTGWTAIADAMDDSGFTVTRLAMCEGIMDREPIGASNVFPETIEKVYCFLEASNITRDTEITFVWYSRDTEMARTTLPIKKGWRWRTYSSKKLTGLAKGQWRVDVQDASGLVLNSIDFRLE